MFINIFANTLKKNGWIEDYCDGLWASSLPDDLKGQIEEYKDELIGLNNKIQGMGKKDLIEYALDEALAQVPDGVIKKKLAETAAKSVAKAGIGTVAETSGVGLVVTAGLYAWTGYDIYQFKNKLTEVIGDAAVEYTGMMVDTDKVKEKLQEQVDALKGEATPNKVLGKMQELKANSSPCLKARKCKLTTFKNSKKINDNNSFCPCQTGHHLLPDAMFRTADESLKKGLIRNKQPTGDCWGGYTEGGSLVICAEGGFSGGSHGSLHDETTDIIERARGKTKTELNYTDVRTKVVENASGKYGCQKKCLESQLDEYCSKAHTCGDLKDAKVLAHTGKSNGGPGPKPQRTGRKRKSGGKASVK